MPSCRSFQESRAWATFPGSNIRPHRFPGHPPASFVADEQRSKGSAEVFRVVEKFIRHDYVLRTQREAIVADLRGVPLVSTRIENSANASTRIRDQILVPPRCTESKAA
jgi:hypothetical protein